jgi:MYXO-CTERM domain-containing protein
MNGKTRGMMWLLGLAALLCIPSAAVGFQQTETCTESGLYACESGEKPKALHWNARCVRYRINEEGTQNFSGSSKDVPNIEELRRSVADAFRAWNEISCSDMTLVDGGLTSDGDATYKSGGESNTNLVLWHDDGWSAVASARAFALTSVTYNPKNGVIADADIEVNTEFYRFSAGEEPEASHVDLRNTMTHEVGHFVGLDHTDIREATMFGTAPVGEIAKRSLHPDDIEGLCTTYPSEERSQSLCDDPGDFPTDDLAESSGICTITGADGPAPSGLALVLLGLLGLVAWRR